jgi:HPt (histidine-containing phosphotransfer) domain-containing protein
MYEDLPVLDEAQLDDIAGGNIATRKKFCQLFIDNIGSYIENLQHAVTNMDEQHWRDTAHALKGAASNLGAVRLAKLCSDAQNLAPITLDSKTVLAASIAHAHQELDERLKSIVKEC